MLDHCVLFKAIPGREPDVEAALRRFEEGMAGAPFLVDLAWGPNVNDRSLEMGWTHGMLTRLTDREALRGDYWDHPAHAELLEDLDRCCELRFAIDYEVDR